MIRGSSAVLWAHEHCDADCDTYHDERGARHVNHGYARHHDYAPGDGHGREVGAVWGDRPHRRHSMRVRFDVREGE